MCAYNTFFSTVLRQAFKKSSTGVADVLGIISSFNRRVRLSKTSLVTMNDTQSHQ
jgi:hypothetical protein